MCRRQRLGHLRRPASPWVVSHTFLLPPHPAGFIIRLAVGVTGARRHACSAPAGVGSSVVQADGAGRRLGACPSMRPPPGCRFGTGLPGFWLRTRPVFPPAVSASAPLTSLLASCPLCFPCRRHPAASAWSPGSVHGLWGRSCCACGVLKHPRGPRLSPGHHGRPLGSCPVPLVSHRRGRGFSSVLGVSL